MQHLEIWIRIFALMAGTGLLFDTYRFYKKYGHPFLKAAWWCCFFLNLGFLTGALSQYLLINLFEDKLVYKDSFYGEIIDPFSSIFFAGLAYFLVSLYRSFLGKTPPPGLRGAFVGVVVLIAARAITGLVGDLPGPAGRAIDVLNIIVLICVFVLTLAVLGVMAFWSRRNIEEENKARMVRHFGFFYLCGCGLITVTATFAGAYQSLIVVTVGLLFNVYPYLWYRRYLPSISNSLGALAAAADFSAVYEKYGISIRQREIIELLLRGKSNRDIAEALFIAPHTVKNHIYTLYQKLGVKSRFELIDLFLQAGNRGDKSKAGE